MPPKPRKGLRRHALIRAREAPHFPFCMGVGGGINQQFTHSHTCAREHWGEEGTEAKVALTALLALQQSHSQSEARVTQLLAGAAEGTEQQFPGFSLPLEQHRKGSALATSWFLFTTHRLRAPAIDCHVFRVRCKHKFLSLCFLLWGFPPSMPHCCMPSRAFRLSYTAELAHLSHTVSKCLTPLSPNSSFFVKKSVLIKCFLSGICPHPDPPRKGVGTGKEINSRKKKKTLNLVLNSFNQTWDSLTMLS